MMTLSILRATETLAALQGTKFSELWFKVDQFGSFQKVGASFGVVLSKVGRKGPRLPVWALEKHNKLEKVKRHTRKNKTNKKKKQRNMFSVTKDAKSSRIPSLSNSWCSLMFAVSVPWVSYILRGDNVLTWANTHAEFRGQWGCWGVPELFWVLSPVPCMESVPLRWSWSHHPYKEWLFVYRIRQCWTKSPTESIWWAEPKLCVLCLVWYLVELSLCEFRSPQEESSGSHLSLRPHMQSPLASGYSCG